ncbi:MAG: anhydro-N-acetylmuramic acid kinase [Phaeodactylibacter sp.]|nr:anhydro-N-acetylmuramic acid kinase [Phaeodactylibacter sp.]MCB9053168.1 anhydro-N-acetylmuramic acid kinase [Lewinellaceae bacterium]
MPQQEYHALGLMSGSSLDGLDIAYCRFGVSQGPNGPEINSWSILSARTISFSEEWCKRLAALPESSALELALAHAQFGRYVGELVAGFLEDEEADPGLIASHGHTIFHYPEQGMTLQIGDGAAIAAITGYPTIDNFRMQDVAFGGQGAPLAPIADKMLFPEYDLMLNLGGIANMTYKGPGRYIAFDNTGANQVLNALAGQLGLPYDDGGQLAAKGHLLPGLLEKAEQLDFFKRPYPKSLGNDWVRDHMVAPYLAYEAPAEDKLHTACWQIARQIAADLDKVLRAEGHPGRTLRMMATGGGVFNTFLMDCIREECEKICSLVIEAPAPEVAAFKEAALMALMGVLRVSNIPNCLPSVTNAARPAIGGAIHQGWRRQV